MFSFSSLILLMREVVILAAARNGDWYAPLDRDLCFYCLKLDSSELS